MVTKSDFWFTSDGEKVSLYTIKNKKGAYVEVIDYGCTVRSIVVPARNGAMTDVCLGHENMEDYEKDDSFIGATVGRFANRIGGAKFTLNGKEYKLFVNDNGVNCLHSGKKAFDKYVWKYVSETENSVAFSHFSPDGDSNFPGNLTVEITYGFSDDNELTIEYKAKSDQDTPLNLTNHSYFNLDGIQSESILDQTLKLNAAFVTEAGEGLIPTGKILPVDENLFNFNDVTPFDFTQPKKLGRDIEVDNQQLKVANGYDHNFVLDGSGYREIAVAHSDESGITMRVYTDRPCVQLYTANWLSGNVTGKGGRRHVKRCAFCLETQEFPDAVNKPEFKSCILKAGDEFYSKTAYAFESAEGQTVTF